MAARRMFPDHRAANLARLMDGFIYSGHENFSESTEEIAPLTEEEKKQRLEELRAKMAEKRAKQAIEDKEEQKKNEVCSSPFRVHSLRIHIYHSLRSSLSAHHKLTPNRKSG